MRNSFKSMKLKWKIKSKNNPNKHSTRHRKPPFWDYKLEELYKEA